MMFNLDKVHYKYNFVGRSFGFPDVRKTEKVAKTRGFPDVKKTPQNAVNMGFRDVTKTHRVVKGDRGNV